MFNTDNPEFTVINRSRTDYIPALDIPWTTGEETEEAGILTSRQFSEFEFLPPVQLSLGMGPPPATDGSYFFHYLVESEVGEHVYSGTDEDAFQTWLHKVNLWKQARYWTDDLQFSVSWQLRSRPDTNTPATDALYTFNSQGALINTQTLQEAATVSLDAGSTWGVRMQSSSSSLFSAEVWTATTGGSFVHPIQQGAQLTVPQSGLPLGTPTAPVRQVPPNYAPTLVEYPYIRLNGQVPRPVLMQPATDPKTGLPVINSMTGLQTQTVVIQMIAQIDLFFFGAYSSQDLDLLNIFHQPVLTHSPETAPSARLKPPGKESLSDVFVEQQTRITPNAVWR